MLSRLGRLTKINPRLVFFIVLSSGLFYLLFIWRLDYLGLSNSETTAAGNSSSIKAIIDNPLYGPHKLIQYGLQNLFEFSAFSLRLTSVILAVLFIVCFYLISAKWFGKIIALAATIIFASLPWTIIFGRSGTPFILFLSPVLVLASYYWLARTKNRVNIAWLVFCFIIAASLYIPGLIWLFLAALIVSRKILWFNVKRLSKLTFMGGFLLSVLILSPLIYSLVVSPNLLKSLALIPNDLPTVTDFLKNIGWSVLTLFVRAKEQMEFIIGRLPILTTLVSVLMIFGVYAMQSSSRKKLYWLLCMVIGAVIFSGLNNLSIFLIFALTPLAVIASAGLRFLYLEWQNVFPKNPIPRNFAYVLILALSLIHLIYGFNYSLLAWPNTPETRMIYVIK
ncbi:hypothetical protein A3F65_03800 [Candidatus Saccharibacteria bacterium RIFCSPHIGHO2_12_FULL_47_16b]|nr:MAG: hypothetical protein A3F65_03800 [Candidatus Saccharibacteria bacterium RIFCSPHIGHO2_12_FULL_47_16b]OGL40254.1 MAG: hypothetical protein A3J32_03350 [Candidatus Saccharibacteria bacterium RIFCSPLOWO2_02_FULL_46_7]